MPCYNEADLWKTITERKDADFMKAVEMAASIDATMVQAAHDLKQIDELIAAAREYRFACCFVLPCYFCYVKEGLEGSGVHNGMAIGFPSGGETKDSKLFQAREAVALGADEIDMVINLGFLLSGKEDAVIDEIRAIKDVVCERPLKCIIEAGLLSDDMIRRASLCVVKGGAEYVKTATGWHQPTTLEQVRLIRETIGDAALIKAAGGIRTREAAEALIAAGASRLGIGLKSAREILDSMR